MRSTLRRAALRSGNDVQRIIGRHYELRSLRSAHTVIHNTERARAAVGEDFIVIFRIAAMDMLEGGMSREEVMALARAVEAAGASIISTHFTWHEARPNVGNSDRCGLYMKFHAKSSPPACGPTIYPTSVHDYLSEEAKHLVPYHRDDGQFAAVREGPVSSNRP